jgi:UTP:GlnB (protein PII) uridylyltransferase
MIKFESNTLVLDSAVSKDDHQAINDFIEHVRDEERKAVLKQIANGDIKITSP